MIKTEFLLTITLQYRAEIVIRGLSVDPIPDSLGYHHRNCTADSKENDSEDLASERVNQTALFSPPPPLIAAICERISQQSHLKGSQWSDGYLWLTVNFLL